jgi:hypothetical protein
MTTILEQARDKLIHLCREENVDVTHPVIVSPLSPDEAIGSEADDSFVIRKGKETVVEATFCGARGQAFTDSPSAWNGALSALLALDLSVTHHRAVFVAALNAVLRFLDRAENTVHCRDDEPGRCGPEIARWMEHRFSKTRVGLIGLQPAILSALVDCFGKNNVRVVDFDPDNIGTVKSGVPIWNGEAKLPRLIASCNVGLATGSSIVNGTIDDILRRFNRAGKPVVFFGNTIAGAAALLSLERVCPFGS